MYHRVLPCSTAFQFAPRGDERPATLTSQAGLRPSLKFFAGDDRFTSLSTHCEVGSSGRYSCLCEDADKRAVFEADPTAARRKAPIERAPSGSCGQCDDRREGVGRWFQIFLLLTRIPSP